MLPLVLALVPRWYVLCHVPYIGMLVFPERWNSSCSSLEGLITSQCSSAPLYESARKAEQAAGQQRPPAYSKARDTGGDNITVHPTPQKGQLCNSYNSKYAHAHMRMVSGHMHARSRTQAPANTVDMWKKPHKGHIMQYYNTFHGAEVTE